MRWRHYWRMFRKYSGRSHHWSSWFWKPWDEFWWDLQVLRASRRLRRLLTSEWQPRNELTHQLASDDWYFNNAVVRLFNAGELDFRWDGTRTHYRRPKENR